VTGSGGLPWGFRSIAGTAAGPALRVPELGGPDNLTFNQFAALVLEATGRRGAVRHIPRPALHAMAWLTAGIKPALARQARAALAMDTLDLTFDPAPTRRAFPDLPETDIRSALKELLEGA